MSDRKLTIVFRNPWPQRSPIRTELYLLRRDGSCTHIDYTNQGGFLRSEESSAHRPSTFPAAARRKALPSALSMQAEAARTMSESIAAYECSA